MALTKHRLRILREWWKARGRVARRRQRSTELIEGSDPAFIRNFLRKEVALGRVIQAEVEHRWEGQVWWDEFVEAPVDRELLRLFAETDPPRKGETPENHAQRLWKVIRSLQPRGADVRPGANRHLEE